MLKKVMIICIALSFVFIGGIAFATGEEPGAAPEEGQEVIPASADSPGDITPPADPTDLTTEGDEPKEEQQPEEAKEGGDGQK